MENPKKIFKTVSDSFAHGPNSTVGRIVFDIGMNDGNDTAYYLKKGYKVVAIEANPRLCDSVAKRFIHEISDGRLVILNIAITDREKTCIFYVNNKNDHWSSLDVKWASRNGSDVTSCEVSGRTLKSVIAIYGCPYFVKSDVEGADIEILRQLFEIGVCPSFISVEDCRLGFEYIELLLKIGYCRFKLSNQAMVPQMNDASVNHRFKLGDSGVFGHDLAGEWLERESFLKLYETSVRSRTSLERIAPGGVWWDIHCAA